jgi:phosphatidylinositol alpha-mannosyltransferase
MGKALRVALVTEFYYPHLGGVTEHVYHFARELVALGHAPLILTSRIGRSSEDSPLVRRLGRSVVVPSNGSFARVTVGWNLRQRIAEILKAEQIDLVHVHGGLAPTLGLVAPEAADRLGIPVVATFHSWFRRSVAYRCFRSILQRKLDRIAAKIAVSEPVVRAMRRCFQAEWDVIPNGISLEDFHPNGLRAGEVRQGAPQLLFLGRLDPRNGLEVVLGAMPRILERYPEATLLVAGDGPLRPYYERLARPVASRVRFLGQVHADRSERYATSDLYLCPTNRASFGITLLEAMACGTPMIVSEITGFRELVGDSGDAVLVPAGDSAAWAQAVIELIGNPACRAAMGAAGRAHAIEFSWPSVAARVLRVYDRVLGASPSASPT